MDSSQPNKALDEAVLGTITRHPGATLAGVRDLVPVEATAREIDRSLQRLRKKNLIHYGGPGTTFTGWRTKPQAP